MLAVTSGVYRTFFCLSWATPIVGVAKSQARWLHDLIAPLVASVIVCDRRGERRHGNKNDRSEADELSELLRRGGLRAVYHGNGHRVRLKELTRAYQNLVGDTTRVMLRLKALFRARGIKTPGQGIYHNLEQRPQWLAQLADPGSQLRAELLWTQLDLLRKLRPRQGGHDHRGPAMSFAWPPISFQTPGTPGQPQVLPLGAKTSSSS